MLELNELIDAENSYLIAGDSQALMAILMSSFYPIWVKAVGKEGSNPIYKDIALTNQNLRGGLLNTEGNTSPYAEYITDDIKAQIMGGNNPNVSGQYSTNFAGGRGTISGQYDATGLAANAAYEKQLQDNFLLKLFGNINPYDRSRGLQIGKQF